MTADVSNQAGTPAGQATRALTVDETLPTLVNDANSVIGSAAVTGSVLGNDSDANGGALTVECRRASLLVSGGTLAGLYGTLALNPDGSYRYLAGNTVALAEGQVADDVFTYAAQDQNGNSATATLDIKVTGHIGGVMDVVSYTATESKTGDTISGALYDNAGKYSVGSSVVTGPDNLGGTWTYTVTGIGRADAAHQDVSYAGLSYDFDYLDVDTAKTYDTFYGYAGFIQGNNDKADFSGSNGLGSDGDLAMINGKPVAIGSGKYAVPENVQVTAGMQAVSFQATESRTGDVITGVLFDNTGRYSVGSSVTAPGLDQLGGSWTYTVTSIADADATHQSQSYENFVYDLTYRDADLGTTTNTVFRHDGAQHRRQRSHRQLFGQRRPRLRRRPGHGARPDLRRSPAANTWWRSRRPRPVR